MDYLGKSEDYRHRSRQSRETSHSKESRPYSRDNYKNDMHRSRSPVSRPKSRQFYDSSQRSHNIQYNTSPTYHQQQSKNFNRYESSSEYNANKSNNNNYGGMGKSFNPGQPSRTVMLRQLPVELEDADLRTELNMQSVPYKNIRLVKNRDTGQSRGFAFVEFGTTDEAQRWMQATQGWLSFQCCDARIQMFFSSSKEDLEAGAPSDWMCAKCGIKNFKRRDHCFKCNISRDESEKKLNSDGYDHISNTPCDTLTLRGLNKVTTDETLLCVVNTKTNFCLTVKNCYIVRDPFTGVSRGFALIEANSISEATSLLDILSSDFEVDSKAIDVTFSRNTFKIALTQLNLANSQDSNVRGFSYSQVNPFIAQANPKNPRANQVDQVNSAAAVAQKAMQNMHKKQEFINHITSQLKQEHMAGAGLYEGMQAGYSDTAKIDMNVAQIYPPPDTTKFVYDETSGYYYDYSTRFYYDPKSQYYFNSDTQQYMYWDSILSTYKPVAVNTTEIAVSKQDVEKPVNSIPVVEATEEKTKNAPTKTAAQIAKDMEKWAKSQNNKKFSVATKKPVAAKPQTVVAAAFVSQVKGQIENEAVEDGADEPEEEVKEKEPEESCPAPDQQSKPAISSDPDNSQESTSRIVQEKEPSFIDAKKIACLLCKRQFDSMEILNKHIAKSDLHKKNLEKYNQEKANENQEVDKEKDEISNEQNRLADSDSLTSALKYRDRASERRTKYGQPEKPVLEKKAKKREMLSENDDYLGSLAAAPSLLENTESVASKLMKKMGWNEGSGIGKNLQGISAPIQATMRAKGAGLGAAGGYDADPNDSYSEAVKKSARARYESLQ